MQDNHPVPRSSDYETCYNNNNFIYTIESEVKLCSVVFTNGNAIQWINKTAIRLVVRYKRQYFHKLPTLF